MSQSTRKRPKRTSLPDWYYRVTDKDIWRRPEDFDEDLSELEEPGELEELDNDGRDDASCYCESDVSECECQDDLLTDDSWSERSYDGQDAVNYYDLKAEREERKWALWERKRYEEIGKEYHRELDLRKTKLVEEEFKKHQRAASQGHAPPHLGSLIHKHFKLNCVDHVDWFYKNPGFGTRYVEFYVLPSFGQVPEPKDIMTGHVYLTDETVCIFQRFTAPSQPGLKKRNFAIWGSYTKVSVQFIGNDYLILTLPAELVFDRGRLLLSAPKYFTFFGIESETDFKNEREEMRREEEMKKKKK